MNLDFEKYADLIWSWNGIKIPILKLQTRQLEYLIEMLTINESHWWYNHKKKDWIISINEILNYRNKVALEKISCTHFNKRVSSNADRFLANLCNIFPDSPFAQDWEKEMKLILQDESM